jgi:hypothetical protein
MEPIHTELGGTRKLAIKVRVDITGYPFWLDTILSQLPGPQPLQWYWFVSPIPHTAIG